MIPGDPEQLALTLNGKKTNLHRSDFMVFAVTCGIPVKSAEKMINKIASMQSIYLSMCRSSYLPESKKELLEKLIIERAF